MTDIARNTSRELEYKSYDANFELKERQPSSAE